MPCSEYFAASFEVLCYAQSLLLQPFFLLSISLPLLFHCFILLQYSKPLSCSYSDGVFSPPSSLPPGPVEPLFGPSAGSVEEETTAHYSGEKLETITKGHSEKS